MNHNIPFVGASMRPAVPEAMSRTCMQRISVRRRATMCLECVRLEPELDRDRASMALTSALDPHRTKGVNFGLSVRPYASQDHVRSGILGASTQ
jgi:hypothetical protein